MSGLSREMIIHPGETLKEILEEREMSQRELALRTGFTGKHISTVLNGEKNISVCFAKKLEYALNIDAEFWMNLQNQYDKELIEFDELHSISEEETSIFKALKEVFSFLVRNSLVEDIKKVDQCILELRKFFNVSNLASIPSIVNAGAFRAQTNVKYDPYILFSWLKICELYAEKIETENLAPEDQMEKLKTISQKIKELSLLPKDTFLTKLQEYFSSCGIAFVIIPSFKGAPVQGFIKTTQDGKTTIGMTFRQKRADIFWFTLFHEIGHFINGDSKHKFIDFESVDNNCEKKADKFAQDMLLNSSDYSKLVNENNFSISRIVSFSEAQHVSPSIVIGRLQKEGLIGWQEYSNFIEKYEM